MTISKEQFEEWRSPPSPETRYEIQKLADFIICIFELIGAKKGTCFDNCFISGSFARGTSTGPNIQDVDLILVYSSAKDQTRWDNDNFVKNRVNLRNWLEELDTNYRRNEISPRKHVSFLTISGVNLSIRLQDTSLGILVNMHSVDDLDWNSNLTFDIVPAKNYGDGQYQISKKYAPNNPLTDPRAAISMTKSCTRIHFTSYSIPANRNWVGTFLDCVRFMKKWNENNNFMRNGEKLIKGFHLELLCCSFARKFPCPPQADFYEFLDQLVTDLKDILSFKVQVPGFFSADKCLDVPSDSVLTLKVHLEELLQSIKLARIVN